MAIAGSIVRPLPIGTVAILGMTATALTGTLTITESLSGSQDTSISG
jgi:DASS family divalent anion:Na+ symporter